MENNGGSGVAWGKTKGVLNANCRLSQVIADSCCKGDPGEMVGKIK
jgi:hypothetical protein